MYTEKDISEFFERFKSLQNSFNLEKVHQLINNPDAKATHKVNSHFKPLKIIIMTSAFIIGIATILLWFVPENSNTAVTSDRSLEKPITNVQKDVSPDTETVTKQNNIVSGMPNKNNAKNNKQNIIVADTSTKPDTKSKDINTDKVLLAGADQNSKKDVVKPQQIVKKKKENSSVCNWPTDTIINKDLLLVKLSDEELKKIGIARKGIATFYHNICPNGNCDWELSCQKDLIPENERITTHNDFYVLYVTNSSFEPQGDLDFYSSMDVLVPVVTNNQAGQIFWFTPDDSLFAKLPPRYSYLKNTYDNLICLKERYPNKTFTNFLSVGGESVLDAVNYLNLTKQELTNIGVIINKDNIVFQTKNKHYTLKISGHGISSTGSDADFVNFPPNPYPVAMTDTLGRRIFVQESIIDKDSLSQIMNILVPVRINLNEIIPSDHHVMICWYYPTEDFLNSLPDKIGTELKSEVEINN